MTPESSRKEALRLEGYLWAEMREVRRRLAPASRCDPDAAVHGARRAIKKLRAALRLAREAFPKKELAPVEGPLRNAARLLGPLRDRTVLVKTARRLSTRSPSFPPLPVAGRMGDAKRELALAARALRKLSWGGLRSGFLTRGLKRFHKRGKNALREAESRPSVVSFHRLRKRTKDFVHALEIVGPDSLREGRQILKKGVRLANELGDAHDLDLLVGKIAKEESSLRRRARKKRGMLREAALRKGRAFFGRKPKRAFRAPAE